MLHATSRRLASRTTQLRRSWVRAAWASCTCTRRAPGSQVALKLSCPSEIDERARKCFGGSQRRGGLNHPNIVHLYSVEEADGHMFITMELVEGRSLRDLLRDGAALPLAKTYFASQMADGLACAHAAGIVHRDFKPGNVMVTADDRVKILDFGVAKLRSRSPHRPRGNDPTGREHGGTCGGNGRLHVARTGAREAGRCSRRSVCAGRRAFEMATGRAPFQGDTAAAVFDQRLNRLQPSLLT